MELETKRDVFVMLIGVEWGGMHFGVKQIIASLVLIE